MEGLLGGLGDSAARMSEDDLRALISTLAAQRLREAIAAATDPSATDAAGGGRSQSASRKAPTELSAERFTSAREFLAVAGPILTAGAAGARDFLVREAVEAAIASEVSSE